MVTPNQAHQNLVASNPAPVVPVRRVSATEFLADASAGVRRLEPAPRPPTTKWGPVLAAAVFVVVLLLGALIVTFSSTQDVVDTVPVPTSVPTPTTPSDPSEAQQVAESLAVAYSSEDFEAVEALLANGTAYGWSRVSDFAAGPVFWTDEEFRSRFEIDTALNTTISLIDCQDLAENRISCAVLRLDDLVRAQQLEPSPDVRWRLTIDAGQVTDWVEHTPDISAYFLDVREPFHRWLDVAHPEIEPPFTHLRGSPWLAETDFASIAAALVVEYASSLGVELDQ